MERTKEIKIEARAFIPEDWDEETISKRLSEYSFGNVLGEDIIHVDALTFVKEVVEESEYEREADLKGLWDEIESKSDSFLDEYSNEVTTCITMNDLETILRRRAISTYE